MCRNLCQRTGKTQEIQRLRTFRDPQLSREDTHVREMFLPSSRPRDLAHRVSTWLLMKDVTTTSSRDKRLPSAIRRHIKGTEDKGEFVSASCTDVLLQRQQRDQFHFSFEKCLAAARHASTTRGVLTISSIEGSSRQAGQNQTNLRATMEVALNLNLHASFQKLS
ncbi:hypothetical protein K503DRAFT_775328 [Rhizopogon vinicolor AM-OR11-026]|uniref:Uncharacterized protein n=1 Tax=Rhizopogon vinicolor AM-OR11-026 TaxID=1314800 RepID=A0A1B7MM87_9AGAM|nr:hypothetical protein K503DRAFT_775328 [Rhizopogon vinicolor AM-OR11-026]